MTKLKFCGNTDVSTLSVINRIKPDYIGFIMTKRFWRCISPENLLKFRDGLSSEILTVGVFVDEPLEYVLDAMAKNCLDIAQLHGSEDAEYINRVQDMSKKPVIKAFKVGTPEDVAAAAASPAEYVLLDSGTGTGRAFDWGLIKNLGRKYFLAGGLTPETVADAVKRLKPYAVDVSSGIETDRAKDPEKMLKFAAQLRGTV